MFTAALFAEARTWKQPRCPPTDEWIKMSWYLYTMEYHCCCSVTKSCLTLCYPMDCRMPGLLFLTTSWSMPKFMSIELGMLSNHLILGHPLLLSPSIFPSIRIFSSESAICVRWPKNPMNNGILLSHKKEHNWFICRDVSELRVCHTEWSKSEREKQISYINTYM